MARVKFVNGTIENAKCEAGKSASFTWDSEAPGLGLRVAHGGAKRYIFQSKVKKQREVVRIRIGDVGSWTLEAARAEARRLKVLMDGGHDPRQIEADGLAAKQEARDAKKNLADAKKQQEFREAVTLGDVWPKYVEDRKPQWSELHLRDHQRIIQLGGVQRTRSPKLTEPGPLASLASVRLVDLTLECIEEWAKTEAKIRPTRARLALRLLKACLFWCAAHKEYAGIINVNSAQSKKARESLGKPKTKKYDLLAREQLPVWFAAVRQIGNPVVSAYLQVLLLTGARREELACLKFEDVDFQWDSIRLNDKVEDFRMVPLTPYVKHLMNTLPRREGGWVFSSATSKSGHLTDPSIAHRKACAIAGLDVSLHGLRRSFATLSEWIEMPKGIGAQIQGHQPQGTRDNNYIFRPLDLLRMWHVKIEGWMLEHADISYAAEAAGLRLVTAA